MMWKSFLIVSMLMIINTTYSVEYEGIIRLVDLYGFPFGPINPTGYFPEHRIQYRDIDDPKYNILVYYNVTDPLTGLPTPMAIIEFCKIHEVDSLTSLYNLTTIIATYALPMGFSCKTAQGTKMMAQNLRSKYSLPREPTTCNQFNITAEFTDLTKTAIPWLTMIFTVTKPGGPCDKPTIPTPELPEQPNDPPEQPNDPPGGQISI